MNGKLLWKCNGKVEILESNKPFALLQTLKKQYLKQPQFDKSKGELKITY